MKIFNLFKSHASRLKEARLLLESDLRNNDMSFLVNTMASEELYSPLLQRKRRTEISNTDQVSWYACRRAETLSTEDEKEALLQLLALPAYEAKKRHLFFCLAYVCTNTKDNALFNFLMMHLEHEKDADVNISILIGIEKMDKTAAGLNIEPIKQLAKKRGVHLKTNAILALAKTADPEVEPLLLGLFAATKDSHMKNIICTTLETVGTRACVPLLTEAYRKTRNSLLRQGIDLVLNAVKSRTISNTP
ncbi:HEAT repeat domain-containing protein [Cytophaga hutchinsonii]|uniref:HEAT repeat domain-containing protein n=1 Tax=Cytophaga hutchinsonii (strain ATCC 33406 / DSM 1761 / CIP 103989 / NBRC 15051 / NCIMB 9469 / D465) TaxID=269798 RepID=A0A6N4SRL7_CYTH3|nr:HEAT repeat domain-containing protein [Cytophaga hutchinsonii]ABG59019.1 hypothetical protein CHU_1752 [Cytophaga hutchinsonii ATCC 33406]SFX38834.1 hypothetical protein SAMN04487930_103291 [Cytophaga hutchinsonii ATCC 33406]